MTENTAERTIILALRLSLAWVFLYAASHQVFVANWSIAGFLNSTKTFHDLFALFTGPVVAPVVSFLVAYGHLLIGLSLLTGLLVRVSSAFGIALMLLYWMAHMDYPYISNTNNYLMDEHIIYALVLGLLIATRAGHFFGLDEWASRQPGVEKNAFLHWVLA